MRTLKDTDKTTPNSAFDAISLNDGERLRGEIEMGLRYDVNRKGEIVEKFDNNEEFSQNIIHWAIKTALEQDSYMALETFIKAGVDIEPAIKDVLDQISDMTNEAKFINFIMDHCPDVYIADKINLHAWVEQDQWDQIQQLLSRDRKIDVNMRDNKGQTPLMMARSSDTVKVLLDAGGDYRATDNKGKTAAFYAVQRFTRSSKISVINNFYWANLDAYQVVEELFNGGRAQEDPKVFLLAKQLQKRLEKGLYFVIGNQLAEHAQPLKNEINSILSLEKRVKLSEILDQNKALTLKQKIPKTSM